MDAYAVLAVCIVLIVVGAYGRYQWLEKGTYRTLKRWWGVESPEIISLQKY